LPLQEDLVDLRVVDHAGDLAPPLVNDLDERPEDRPGGEDGRRDAHAPTGLADLLRDAVRERVAALGAEPRAHLRLADLLRPWIDVPRALDRPAVPELAERERVGVRNVV